jgi:hypothetical protein
MAIGALHRPLRAIFVRMLAVVAATVVTPLSPAAAQPIQWQHRFPGLEHTWRATLAVDGTGAAYFMKVGAAVFDNSVVKFDAGGAMLWSTLMFNPCGSPIFCHSAFQELVADAANVWVLGSSGGGPRQCPIGCNASHVYRLAPSDGSSTPRYSSPLRSSLFDLDATPGSAAVTAGLDSAGGLLVRVDAPALEIRFGQAFERVVVLDSGAIVATALDAGAALLWRYDVSGTLQWSVPIDNAGCSIIAADASERVACMTRWSDRLRSERDGRVGPGAGGGERGHGVRRLGQPLGVRTYGLQHRTLSRHVDQAERQWNGCRHRHDRRRHAFGGVAGDGNRPGRRRLRDGIVAAAAEPDLPTERMITARYTSDGVRQWLATYSGAGNWNDVGDAIVATADGAVVGGTVHDTASASLAVIKYGATALAVPTLTLSATPNPGVQGQAVMLTAVLTGAPPPSGTVAFTDGAGSCAGVLHYNRSPPIARRRPVRSPHRQARISSRSAMAATRSSWRQRRVCCLSWLTDRLRRYRCCSFRSSRCFRYFSRPSRLSAGESRAAKGRMTIAGIRCNEAGRCGDSRCGRSR